MIKFDDSEQPALPVSDTINAHLLAASTHEEDTVPTGARYVLLTASTIAYYNFVTTATIPGDTTDGTASDTLPPGIPILRMIPNFTTTGYVTAGTTALVVNSTDGFTKGATITVKGAGAAGVDLSTTISSINQSTKTITLGASASTTVVDAQVIFAPTTISLIAAGTPVVTLAYYK